MRGYARAREAKSGRWGRLLEVAAVVGATAIAAHADEGRIPIYQATTINQPGSYVLTRDIPSGSTTAIQINASDVDLDLGGRRILRDGGSLAINIASGTTNVRVHDGVISGAYAGIYSAGTTMARIEDIWLSSVTNGITLFGAVETTIARCHVQAPLASGIYVKCPVGAPATLSIVDCEVSSAGGDAILVYEADGAVIRGNRVRGFGLSSASGGYAGIFVDGPSRSCVVEANVVVGGDDDMAIRNAGSDCRIEGNTAATSKVGIYSTGARPTIRGNIASSNVDDGIYSGGAHGSLLENSASGNGDEGIFAAGPYTLILANHSEANLGYGIQASGATIRYRDNMLLGNTQGPVSGGQDAGGNITN